MLEAATLGSLIIKLVGEAQDYTAELDKALNSTDRTTKTMVSMFKYSAVAIASALAAISTAAVFEFAKFDEAMTKSLAIMGDVSQATRKEMEATARSIAKNTATSADKAAEAYYFLASAGMDAQQAMKALPMVEKFAAAGAFDMAHATDLLADSTSALGLASKDAEQNLTNITRVADVLTQAGNISNASAEQFATALRTKTAASLRLLNKDVEEGVAVLAAFADQGIKAENAGESLSVVLRDLQTSAQANKDIWRQFGLSVYDTDGKMRPLVSIIADLEKVMAPMSDQSKKAAFELLGFQDRSVSAIQSLLGTSDKIRAYEAALRSAGGVTREVANKQLESFNQQMLILKNRCNEVLLVIGENLIPILKALNSAFSENYKAADGFDASAQSLATTIKNSLITVVSIMSDSFYGWRIILLTLDMAFTTLGGTIAWFCKSGEVLILALSTTFEKSIKGWAGIFQLAGYGLKKGMGELALWISTKWIQLQDTLNKVMPDSLKFNSAEDKKALEDLKKTVESIKPPDLDMTTANGAALEKATAEWKQFMNETDAFSQRNKETAAEVWKLIDAGAPSERIKAALDAANKKLELEKDAAEALERRKKLEDQILKGNQEYLASLSKVPAAVEPAKNATGKWLADVVKLNTEIAYSWEAALPQLDIYNKMLAAGAITQEQYNRAVDKLNIKSEFIDPLEQAYRKVDEYDAMLKKNLITLDQYNKKVGETLNSASPFIGKNTQAGMPGPGQGFKPPANDPTYTFQTGDSGVDQAMQQQAQIAALNQQYTTQMQVTETYYKQRADAAKGNADTLVAIEQERLKRMNEMQKNYQGQLMNYQAAQNSLTMQSAESLFGSLADIGAAFAGKQSGLYKTMFAASKAFAIADAIVKIQQGIANAAILPWPANLAAIASTAAATASIVSNIASVKMASFEGGGLTANGPRIGGVDGKGGKLAVMHPNERVIDLTKDDDVGGKNHVTVNVMNYGNDEVEVQQSDNGKQIDVLIKRAKKEIAADIRVGRGEIPSALENTYKVGRGK